MYNCSEFESGKSMSFKSVQVPGEGSVALVVGEILFIEFVEECRVCFAHHEGHSFDRHLPHGVKRPGDSWGGVVEPAGAGRSITFWHTSPHEECVEEVAARGRTITIGNTTP